MVRFHTGEAAPGVRLTLPAAAARHAKDVLRLRPGALVQLFDGAGAEFAGRIERMTKDRVEIHVVEQVSPSRPESPLRLVLALPPLKGDLVELALQKATELGVTELWPVVTARTDAAGRPALKGTRQERWERVTVSACEQCGRATLPRIAAAMTFEALLRAPFDGTRLMLATGTGGRPMTALPAPQAVLLLVGPPGGWEAQEVARALEAGLLLTALGPRVLRTETAAIAAVTLAQALWGDLGAASTQEPEAADPADHQPDSPGQ
jgi:16S rRNA (uracil1498-N3)-methyltransferase